MQDRVTVDYSVAKQPKHIYNGTARRHMIDRYTNLFHMQMYVQYRTLRTGTVRIVYYIPHNQFHL